MFNYINNDSMCTTIISYCLSKLKPSNIASDGRPKPCNYYMRGFKLFGSRHIIVTNWSLSECIVTY